MVFMTRPKVEAMLRKGRRKPQYLLGLNPPYGIEVAAKSYPWGMSLFQKFAVRRGNTHEYVVRFIDSIEAHSNDADLC